MKKPPFPLLLLMALPLQVNAWDIQVLEGSIEAGLVQKAVAGQDDWYTRAINVCITHGSCQKPVIMDFRIEADGKARDCSLIDSDISRPEVAGLFCQVAVNTPYPASGSAAHVRASTDIHLFGASGQESCHDERGRNRMENPGVVFDCLNRALPVLNSTRSSLINQFGGEASRFTGRMSVAMTVKKNGKVSDVEETGSDIPARELRRAVIHTLEILRFDPADSKATYRFTIPIPFRTIEPPANTQE